MVCRNKQLVVLNLQPVLLKRPWLEMRVSQDDVIKKAAVKPQTVKNCVKSTMKVWYVYVMHIPCFDLRRVIVSLSLLTDMIFFANYKCI